MIWSQNLHNSLHYSVLTRILSLSIKVVTIWLVWATSESIRTLSKFSSLCCGSRHLVPDLTQEWLRCQYFIQCSKNIFLQQHSCSEPIFTFVHQLSFIIRNMILEPLWSVSWWRILNIFQQHRDWNFSVELVLKSLLMIFFFHFKMLKMLRRSRILCLTGGTENRIETLQD